MSHFADPHAQSVPRTVLFSAGALVAFAMAAVVIGRSAGVGDVHMPSNQAYSVLRLNFVDAQDGGVLVRDAESGALLKRVEPGTNGFLRSALRGFAHERMRDGIGAATPFTLTRWRDGTLSLQDEETRRRIDLDAFGPTQAQAFAQLFDVREDVK